MNSIREMLFDLLLNALLQIGCFALLGAAFSQLVKRAKVTHQHLFYGLVLLFCLVAPVANTFYRSLPASTAANSQAMFTSHVAVTNRELLVQGRVSKRLVPFAVTPAIEDWILSVWAALVLLGIARLTRAVGRIHRLRNEASLLSRAQMGSAANMIDAKDRVTFLLSAAIDGPVTIGMFRPAIVLPSKLSSLFGQRELSAILAHEYGHIRRKDFGIQLALELLTLPVAWHPGIVYLMSKISQTRELACDDYAAARIGKRRSYAQTLLNLASLCLSASRNDDMALGIFDGDDFEKRIMTLTTKTLTLSRTALLGVVLAIGISFGAG